MDPLLLQATIATAMAGYMALLVLPEPISKAIAIALTVHMVGYLGWDTFWSIIQGWRRLTAEAKTARTFAEVSVAGQRFGRIMGAQSARIFVMAVTAALGQTAGLPVKGPRLPGYAQAALTAEMQGLRLSAVSQIESVLVGADGTLTIALAHGPLAVSSGPRISGGHVESDESASVTSGVERAPKLGRPNSIYEQVDLNGRGALSNLL